MSWFNFLKKDKEPERTWAVFDVNDKEFQQQVIRRSYKTSVMVDLWGCGYKLCKIGGFDWVGRPMVGVGRRGMMLTTTMTCPPRRLTLHGQAVSSRARQAEWMAKGFR